MEPQPKYYMFDRRWIGNMETAKRMIEAAAGISTLTAYPWLAGILIVVRVGLSFVVSASEPVNPINIKSTKSVDATTEVRTDPPPMQL